jgi:hypothetical protein
VNFPSRSSQPLEFLHFCSIIRKKIEKHHMTAFLSSSFFFCSLCFGTICILFFSSLPFLCCARMCRCKRKREEKKHFLKGKKLRLNRGDQTKKQRQMTFRLFSQIDDNETDEKKRVKRHKDTSKLKLKGKGKKKTCDTQTLRHFFCQAWQAGSLNGIRESFAIPRNLKGKYFFCPCRKMILVNFTFFSLLLHCFKVLLHISSLLLAKHAWNMWFEAKKILLFSQLFFSFLLPCQTPHKNFNCNSLP